MQVTIEDALKQLGGDSGKLFATVMEHGTMSVEVYRPIGTDKQTPHKQDELYMVISGSGDFINGEKRSAFQQGDVLFVRAGVVHRFENFTDDFLTWVIFYGPEGGEK